MTIPRLFPSTIGLYVAKRFLAMIVITFLVCSFLIFVIDLVEMLRQSGKRGTVPGVLVGSIGALLMLSRKSELAVIRAAGVSAWQFLRPGIAVAFILGVMSVTLYNPLAANARAYADALFNEYFGKESSLLRPDAGNGAWLRQDGIDGQSVLMAAGTARSGMQLNTVTAFIFDSEGRFKERADAARANLLDGFWRLEEVIVARPGEEPAKYGSYLLSTYLTPERATDSLGKAIAISFWELPALIEVAEKAKLSSASLRLQYELLLSRPFLCVAMVLLAATVSLKSFRSGGIQTMVVTGMIGGFGFFLLAEIFPDRTGDDRHDNGAVAPGGWLSDACSAATAGNEDMGPVDRSPLDGGVGRVRVRLRCPCRAARASRTRSERKLRSSVAQRSRLPQTQGRDVRRHQEIRRQAAAAPAGR
ncbi:MAG: LptF/LptG family permease [Hyphomicrobium sp.]|nr:LptF/LptG family permease [Hyphomicrobium sp.]